MDLKAAVEAKNDKDVVAAEIIKTLRLAPDLSPELKELLAAHAAASQRLEALMTSREPSGACSEAA
jgi:hypothetical protein